MLCKLLTINYKLVLGNSTRIFSAQNINGILQGARKYGFHVRYVGS